MKSTKKDSGKSAKRKSAKKKHVVMENLSYEESSSTLAFHFFHMMTSWQQTPQDLILFRTKYQVGNTLTGG